MNHRRWFGMMIGLAVGFGLASGAQAAEGTPGPLRKLGRGIANIGTSPLELIRTPEMVGRRDGYFAALSTGIVEGAWRCFLRTAAGIFEVGTFFSGIPNDYEPIVRPEFVWAHGNWAE